MNDLDILLLQLRDEASDPRLGALETSVMAGLATRSEAVVARRGLLLAGVMAAIVGVGFSATWTGPGRLPDQALLGIPAAAPSRLLAE